MPDRFSDEPRFTNARLTRDQNGLPMPSIRLLYELDECIKMRAATDEYRTHNRLCKRYYHRIWLLPDEAALSESHSYQSFFHNSDRDICAFQRVAYYIKSG